MAIEKKTRTPAAKPAAAARPQASSRPMHQSFQHRLDDGRIVDINIEIGSVPVGPIPPRPKKDDFVTQYWMDQNQVLSINVRVMKKPRPYSPS